ncbi:MAG TPA: bifunctional adenosylcobinamide kinase/adenosylcobinamide-phosphate guanylyltransferase [Nitrospinota bacterium]|nr:bifunctional adenosylcobinamide kinase/adenosylcobinamide-phosphate guanylyltransferase [Nitrospinota bacterium]|tara:strand:- start:224219 stop:224752 length:534 start_codon:yes stop_codon:yes gene_type:complete
MITLVTGGCRSGKSSYALSLAESCLGPKVFIATARADDDEMLLRVEKHRKERDMKVWKTIEEPINLSTVAEELKPDSTVLVDCLTLWVSNLMHDYHLNDKKMTEDKIADLACKLLSTCRETGSDFIFVTNEVGLGVAPVNNVARLYRDLVGRVNQVVAAEADKVYFLMSSIPTKIKG